jgi:hypothetical protein
MAPQELDAEPKASAIEVFVIGTDVNAPRRITAKTI